MTSLIATSTYTFPAPDCRPRAKSGRVRLSTWAKLNCLALVCLLKVVLVALMFFRWQASAELKPATVLSVRVVANDRVPAVLPAPPEPVVPTIAPMAVSMPQFHIESAVPSLSPPLQSQPAPSAATATPAIQADPNPYYQLLLHQIAQHKRYPLPAKRAKQQGLVEISFEIAADGRLLSARVSQSSQNPSLDAAALAAVTAASPFPPIPSELGLSRLSLSLPIEFSLR